jgi:hypothetical protein
MQLNMKLKKKLRQIYESVFYTRKYWYLVMLNSEKHDMQTKVAITTTIVETIGPCLSRQLAIGQTVSAFLKSRPKCIQCNILHYTRVSKSVYKDYLAHKDDINTTNTYSL